MQISRNINLLPLMISIVVLTSLALQTTAQVSDAQRTGFTWINTEEVTDLSYGNGYTMYTAAWPLFKAYPGASNFQAGLGSCWLTTQPTGNEPSDFYTTIEGGLGWWGDTRFATKVPKFIMGGVSFNFHSWANGTGAGQSGMLPNGQRDWSTPGGKYGVGQLSNRLLWAPDGLNMAQSLNGELLGYGYTPLPLTDIMPTTSGIDIETGNQCWTLFLNTTNFKGPATFFLPTFWTEPVLEDTSLEGLFLDSRPSNPNVGYGVEHAHSPAIIATDNTGTPYAKLEPLQFPVTSEDNSILMNNISVYSPTALWDAMVAWFNGGPAVQPGLDENGVFGVNFNNNGGAMVGEISELQSGGILHEIDLNYINPVQQNANTMGFSYDTNTVNTDGSNFVLPEYFKLDPDNKWRPIDQASVPSSTDLTTTDVPTTPPSEIPYLTPLEPDCQWQDPNGPWNSPGPTAGPFTRDLGDGTTLTYYWYKFVDQPAIIQANLPANIRDALQARVELIHSNWSHTDDYIAPPTVGNIATLDPGIIVQPPAGLEVGYVPIVTRQQSTPSKLRVFIMAGQSNMEGYGKISSDEGNPGSLVDIIQNDPNGEWSDVGSVGSWNTLDDVHLYFDHASGIITDNITVGQGAYADLIGPELMFAHQLDDYYDDPVLIIKTAWGGKSLAVDFRPPSAGGTTGPFYNEMIQIVEDVTQNLGTAFPDITVSDYELSGFAWFQGWNDGAEQSYLDEYESNLNHLINDIRADLGVSDLPVVVASSGHGGYLPSTDGWVASMQDIISVAQETVGCDDEVYGGKVGFVDTKAYYYDATESPDDAIHHFNNNALTFLNIGKAIGDEMIKTINAAAFCNDDCEDGEQVSPGIVSIGNRVWNDYDRDGIIDANEPGIPGVSVLLWGDSDGDDIPDWEGFGGVRITDDEGNYSFTGLQPGNYVTFVWSVNNWDPGEPLYGFESTNGFVADANNDVDGDNNGLGNPYTDIMSGIVTLTDGGEPLNDGDDFDCLFDYDGSGNNTVDFGFYKTDQFIWIGAVNSDWNTPDNWSGNVVPNTTSEVLIPAGMPQYPIVDEDVEIYTLCVEIEAELTIIESIDFIVNGQ